MSAKLIPERLRSVRENLGITMAEASRMLNLSKIGYCRYEYGDRSPSPQTIEAIARCFHTSADYLTGQSEHMAPDYIYISEASDPELFEIISFLQNSDVKTRERFIAYIKELKKQQV